MLSENLIRLYNTLALIETKGESTKLMAQCMVFVEQMAAEVRATEQENAKAPETDKKEEQK